MRKDANPVTHQPASDPARDDVIGVEDVAVQRALGGAVDGVTLLRAHVERTGGEHRPQQEEMAQAVADATRSAIPLLAQAGTGTGKSLAYLFPLAASGRRAIVATATNQLSEQLIRHDLPQIADSITATGGTFSFAMLKGRNQYACLQRISDLQALEAAGAAHGSGDAPDTLFDLEDAPTETIASRRRQAKADGADVAELIAWSKKTSSGDRSDGPSVTDRVWSQVSTSSADCPGAASCPFGDVCFTELARKKARAADLVVTNHALLAQEVRLALETTTEHSDTPAAGIFGAADIVVVDEAHDLPDTLTGALSSEVDPRAFTKFLSRAAKYIHDATVTADGESTTIAAIRRDLEGLEEALESVPAGPVEQLPDTVVDLLTAVTTRFLMLHSLLTTAAGEARREDKPKRAAAISTVLAQAGDLAARLVAARTLGEGRVRWVDQRRPEDAPVLRTAPLEVGAALSVALAERTLIATSATLTVAGDFTPIRRALGLEDEAATMIDVGSPFDYPSQGMLYIPRAPFPEPVGKDRTAHTEAVQQEVLELVTAAGGRTLALFTTTRGAQQAAEHLRAHLPHLAVHATGDAPADVLVRQFSSEETSVLCATMGMWQGVDVQGPSLSLVIIDKVAFAPMDDVLTAARRALADSRRRDGFTEVIVAQAATSLAQGVGRLIRARSDRGVVAILDPRIHTKGYGRTLLKSLPPFRVYTDRDVVLGALTRLTGGTTAEARQGTPVSLGRPKTAGRSRTSRTPRKASATRGIARTIKGGSDS
jgi:ATP-dependent DNA helicase DinG